MSKLIPLPPVQEVWPNLLPGCRLPEDFDAADYDSIYLMCNGAYEPDRDSLMAQYMRIDAPLFRWFGRHSRLLTFEIQVFKCVPSEGKFQTAAPVKKYTYGRCSLDYTKYQDYEEIVKQEVSTQFISELSAHLGVFPLKYENLGLTKMLSSRNLANTIAHVGYSGTKLVRVFSK